MLRLKVELVNVIVWLRSAPYLTETVRSWAGLPDSDTDKAYDEAVSAARSALDDPEFMKRRKSVASTDNSFLMFSEEKMLALAAEEKSATVPVVPFRLPGGETAALHFFEGFLVSTTIDDKDSNPKCS